MKGVLFHLTVTCRGRLERRVLPSMEELWQEGWFAAELWQKSSAKEGFAAGLPWAVKKWWQAGYLLQCRDAGIFCLDLALYLSCMGKGRLCWLHTLAGLTWGCLWVPSKQEPVRERKPGWGQERWCISHLMCSHPTSEVYIFC